MNTDIGVVLSLSGHAAGIFLEQSQECYCGRMTSIVINRDGETRCVPCDFWYRTTKCLDS